MKTSHTFSMDTKLIKQARQLDFFTSRKAGQHVLQVEEEQGGVESFSFLEIFFEKIIRKKIIITKN